jgi:cytochrome P450
MFVWGARPKILQALFLEGKRRGAEKTDLHEMLHTWYAKDGGRTLEQEILEQIMTFL